jgi:hypothetical protein
MQADVRRDKLPDVQAGSRVATRELGTGSGRLG